MLHGAGSAALKYEALQAQAAVEVSEASVPESPQSSDLGGSPSIRDPSAKQAAAEETKVPTIKPRLRPVAKKGRKQVPQGP